MLGGHPFRAGEDCKLDGGGHIQSDYVEHIIIVIIIMEVFTFKAIMNEDDSFGDGTYHHHHGGVHILSDYK